MIRALAVLLLLTGSAEAQTRFRPDLTDEIVQALVNHARDTLASVRDAGGNPFPPETPAQRAQPILPLDQARDVADIGFASGIAAWCDLDWRRNFDPMMRRAIASRRWDERQLRFMGVLHLHAMTAARVANNDRACTHEDRTRVQNFIRERWR